MKPYNKPQTEIVALDATENILFGASPTHNPMPFMRYENGRFY